MSGLRGFGPAPALLAALLLAGIGATAPGAIPARPEISFAPGHFSSSGNDTVVANFSAALGRIVTLLGAAGGVILAIAWARVALSWFSNDVSKKMQAKDRARDALIGSLIFAAALSGILWGLAQWVLTGA